MLTGVAAVLCDADGNLFPSEEPAFVASAEVTNAFLASLGIEQRYAPEELRLSTTGKSFRTTATDLAAAHGVTVAAAELQRWVDEERERVTAHLGRVLRPDEAVLEPLRLLAKRYVLAAVSSSATVRLRACLAAADLSGLIPEEAVFSAEDSLPAPLSKPNPAVYLYACQQLAVTPEQAVAVEDSVPGVQSAVAAGVRTIGNLQFVPESEREARSAQLVGAGAVTLVGCWAQVESLLA